MGVRERLRRLDEAVVGPAPAEPAPGWVQAATYGTALWFLLLATVVAYRTVGWLIAAIAYGAVEVPAFVGAVRWHHHHGTIRTRARLAAFATFPFLIGVAVVLAAALAPAPWPRSRSQVNYPRGCHPASAAVTHKVERAVQGGLRVEHVVVFASNDAAVASAVVSGTLDVGGVKVPLDHQPADYVLAPGSLAPNNDLARRLSPSLTPLIASGPIGSAWDQVNNDRVAAETCAAR